MIAEPETMLYISGFNEVYTDATTYLLCVLCLRDATPDLISEDCDYILSTNLRTHSYGAFRQTFLDTREMYSQFAHVSIWD